jgi:hypothetical protein
MIGQKIAQPVKLKFLSKAPACGVGALAKLGPEGKGCKEMLHNESCRVLGAYNLSWNEQTLTP